MLLLDSYADGGLEIWVIDFSELFTALVAATAITAAGILLLYYIEGSS
jgi:hypothetical protein